ncbi:MAG: hypothetical protein KME26_24520 [Oscillatoria princeps RMCB-10]|nr:hypothetical protein [Oscillatoria princeps RMCB-10]
MSETLSPPALPRGGVLSLEGDTSRLEVGERRNFYAQSGTLEDGGLSRLFRPSPGFWGDSCALAQQQPLTNPCRQASRSLT